MMAGSECSSKIQLTARGVGVWAAPAGWVMLSNGYGKATLSLHTEILLKGVAAVGKRVRFEIPAGGLYRG